MNVENNFLEELRRIIEERPRGFQAELAKMLGLRPATFSNMICGRRGMDEDTRRKVAKIIGMHYESVVSGSTVTNSQIVTANKTGSININTQEKNEGHTVTLTDREFYAYTLWRDYGNASLLEKCISQLERARDIFG